MRAKQMGTWQTHQVLSQEAVVASPPELSSVQACTIMSNPTTAYRMLKDYVELGKGEYVIQNGSNSGKSPELDSPPFFPFDVHLKILIIPHK